MVAFWKVEKASEEDGTEEAKLENSLSFLFPSPAMSTRQNKILKSLVLAHAPLHCSRADFHRNFTLDGCFALFLSLPISPSYLNSNGTSHRKPFLPLGLSQGSLPHIHVKPKPFFMCSFHGLQSCFAFVVVNVSPCLPVTVISVLGPPSLFHCCVPNALLSIGPGFWAQRTLTQ